MKTTEQAPYYVIGTPKSAHQHNNLVNMVGGISHMCQPKTGMVSGILVSSE